MLSLQGKSVLITGAASGIGRGTAVAMAKRGADVVIADLDEAGAADVVAEIESIGGDALAVAIDVGADDAFTTLRDRALSRFGRVDVVMNNAGIITRGYPEQMPVTEWQRVLNINLMSVVRSNDAFLPILLEQGSGHIVNTASFAGLYGYAFDRLPYAASKAAIVQVSEGLALYLKPKGIGVTVLCPGPVATNIMASMRTFGEAAETRGPGAQFAVQTPDAVGEMVVDAVLTDRFMLPTDDQVVDILVRRAGDWDGYVNATIASWNG